MGGVQEGEEVKRVVGVGSTRWARRMSIMALRVTFR